MFKLKLISLDGCPYSMAAESFLKDLNIKFDLIKVYQENKDEYKNKDIKTFPQIYMDNILLGGYDDLKEIYDTLSSKKNLDEMIEYLKTKVKNKMTRKEILRIIEFFVKL
jgi:glutaredoxin